MKGQETRGFQSEVKQLLHLMIHSLYSNKEIFLRELISNASDAADKLRFRALSNPDLYQGDGELRVRISADRDNRTLTLSDNGIGMTRDEVIENLGTIAKSGTKAFPESMGPIRRKTASLSGSLAWASTPPLSWRIRSLSVPAPPAPALIRGYSGSLPVRAITPSPISRKPIAAPRSPCICARARMTSG